MSDRVVKLRGDTGGTGDTVFDGLQVLAIVNTPQIRTHLAEKLGSIGGVDYEFAAEGALPHAEIQKRPVFPDAIFIEAPDPETGLNWLKQLRETLGHATTFVCMLTAGDDERAAVRFLRGGADDVLSGTPSKADLTSSLTHASEANRDRLGTGNGDSGRPQTMAFIHASGGSGSTTLAVNTAVYLHSLSKDIGGTCLLDLDLQFGTVDLQLDLAYRSRTRDLIDMPERLDQTMLRELTIEGPDGLRVLTAPDELPPFDVLDFRTVESIMSTARSTFGYVVVDMPHALTTWADAVLRQADRIFVVTQVNVLALREARRLIDTLVEEGVEKRKIRVVANRYPAKGANKFVTAKQAEETLGMPVFAEIPSDFPLIIDSLDQGVPATKLRPKSKFSRSVAQMLREFTGEEVPEEQSSGGGLFGLWR